MLLSFPLSLDAATVTGTTFAPLSSGGASIPTKLLRGRVTAQLALAAAGPGGSVFEGRVSVHENDGSFTPISGLSVKQVAATWAKLATDPVDITALVRREPVLVLRLEGRVTGGTATVAAPVILLTGAGA